MSKVGPKQKAGPYPIMIDNHPSGKRTDFWRALYQDATGGPLKVPFIVARGVRNGPVLGITAAVHGNELNGIKIIQHVLNHLDLESLSGALLCVPVVNVPAYTNGTRNFPDGQDLNHVFPGKTDGKPAHQYARAFTETFLPAIDFLVDLHTASEGRTNTLYVRADLKSADTRQMAFAFNPEIILHVEGSDGTLRYAARRRGVPGITVEAGNPSVLQGRMVFEGETGILNLMKSLGMLEGDPYYAREPVVCKSSRWLRTVGGGILETHFKLRDVLTRKQLIAETHDPFGTVLNRYYAPYDGIVIGMAANPVAIPGTRFCHLGNFGDPGAPA